MEQGAEALATHKNRAGYRHSGEKHTGLTNKIYILTTEGAENAEKYIFGTPVEHPEGTRFNGTGGLHGLQICLQPRFLALVPCSR